MKKLKIILEKLVGINDEVVDLDDLKQQKYERIAETTNAVFYRLDNKYAIYSKAEKRVIKQFQTKRYGIR